MISSVQQVGENCMRKRGNQAVTAGSSRISSPQMIVLGVMKGIRKGIKRMKRLRWFRILCTLTLLITIGFALLLGDIYLFANNRSSANADAAIVLGAAAWGPKPSPVFRERLNEAVKLFQEGRIKSVVVTGGVGRLGGPSESSVGKDYLKDHGIPAEKIFTEEGSRTTWENLVNAKVVCKQHDINSTLIVSDPLHMRRAIAMADGVGLDAKSYPTSTSLYTGGKKTVQFWLREAWYLAGYWLSFRWTRA